MQTAWEDQLNESFKQRFETIEAKLSQEKPFNQLELEQLKRFVCLSDFGFEMVNRFWFDLKWLFEPIDIKELTVLLNAQLTLSENEDSAKEAIRRFRHRVQCQIIFQHINHLCSLKQQLSWITWLADICIQSSSHWLRNFLATSLGIPKDKEGKEIDFVILAMGKQGAYELNLSSDIDLIFCYGKSGNTEGGRRSFDTQEYFTRFGQKLIGLLDAPTVDGRAFRVDMRLRPYGQSGPLVCSFASMQEYYSNQGRDWERFAMIKARVVTGIEQAQSLRDDLTRFSFRQYVDYGAIESLRTMKSLITQEVRRKGLEQNIKLGAGGIREIEFIAQAFQLIRGGQEVDLQTGTCIEILQTLGSEGHLPFEVAKELIDSYQFLRLLEHSLQGLKDEQTQDLPHDALDQLRVALMMGMSAWSDLLTELDSKRKAVTKHFAAIVSEDEVESDGNLADFKLVWSESSKENSIQELANLLDSNLQITDENQINLLADGLRKLKQSKSIRNMQAIAMERLDQLMPKLLCQLVANDNAGETLQRIVPLIESVARRSVYLSLLNENPGALKHLVQLCGASPWVAEMISKYPALLDDLLNPSTLFSPPDKNDLRADLQQKLLRVPEEDLEQQMIVVRQFIQTHKLQVAASELTGSREIMKVSDYLTYIAEVVLEVSLSIIWQQMVARHGYPTNDQNEAVTEPEFVVLGYGKVGGIELSYESDLDLVFIHDGAKGKYTQGERSIDNGTFYTRFGQKLIQFLTAMTPFGAAYEVDMRLRPDGNSGLMVATLNGFKEYQSNEAWTWEHQALVRARYVAGSERLAAEVESVRKQVLSLPRNNVKLAEEVNEMRDKMRSHLGSADGNDVFQIKQDRGGIVDIEFMVQYAVLAWSHEYPSLLRFTDNVRLLDELAEQKLVSHKDAQNLQDAYLNFRSIAHRMALQKLSISIRESNPEFTELGKHRASVQSSWKQIIESNLPA